jgi:sigma-E factor negative regulatory protein RseA
MAEHHDDQQRRQRVSAVMDGDLDEAELQRWLAQESQQPHVQGDWHTYHLIGDVLRSSDLASNKDHDQRLLERVQQSLDTEPVVLAPAAAAATVASSTRSTPIRRRLWASSAAVVAGFAMVAAAFFTTRADFGDAPVITLVSGGQPADDIRRASIAPPGSSLATDSTGMGPAGSAQAPFREILRLPRGPAQRPMESVQVLYSNGSATISVTVEPYRQGEHVPRNETSERLNTLTVHRQDVWLTLSGDVPMGTLHQMALTLPARP